MKVKNNLSNHERFGNFTDPLPIEKPNLFKWDYPTRKKYAEALWSEEELAYISKIDLSTELLDEEDYHTW